MKPSQVSAELRHMASSIDRCRTAPRSDLVTRDLRRVLAGLEGSQDQQELVMQLDLRAAPMVDDDGSLAVQFEGLVTDAGAEISGWEGDALRIMVTQDSRPGVLEMLGAVKAGKHGPELQQLIGPYLESNITVMTEGDDGVWDSIEETWA